LLGVVAQIYLKADIGDHVAHISIAVVYLGKYNIIRKGYTVTYVFLCNSIGNNRKGNKQNTGKEQHKEDYPPIIKPPGPEVFEGHPHAVSLNIVQI
jgi:hypothetical protein